MTRLYISGNAVDQNQIPVVGAQVYVRAGGVNATLEDAAGAPLDNPLITIADGFFEAYSQSGGTHTLEYYWGGKLRRVDTVSEIDRIQAIADSAEASAQIAAAFSGPLYLTTGDGLAATVSGDEFAVDNGDGTAGIYLNNAGVAVLQRTVIINPSNSGASALLGHISDETGAVARTVADKLREWVSPEDFSGTDTAKFNAALATGKSVVCSASDYAITGALSPTADGQVIDLNGALITATGNFDLFNVGALQGVRIRNGRIEAAAMTGGDILNAVGSERLTFEDIIVFNPLNFAYIEEVNVCQISNVWVNNIRGTYGIKWYGETAKRSDILRLFGVNLSFPDTGIGIDWDGNCHTLQAIGVTIVRPNKGLVIRNTSGGSVPSFGFLTGLEIDFPVSYGVEILAGEDYYFGPQFYCHDSTTASGVYVGASVSSERVTFLGGKITDHATYGIENNVRVLTSNLVLINNGTADYLDPDDAYLSAPRIELDDQFYMRFPGGNPAINWDTNDFDGYDRTNNRRFFDINSITRFRLSGADDALEVYVDGALQLVTVGAADSGGTGFRVLRVAN